MTLTNDVERASNLANELRSSLETAIIGQRSLVNGLVYGLLASGPISLTGIPGIAKTHTTKALAAFIESNYARVQVMADLLPSDFTGGEVYNPTTGEWTFKPGPLFADVVHLDELNRVGGRALSGIMEALEESQVSIGGHTYALPDGQIIVATFNPKEHAGTEELPDAVVDRFTVQILIERPSHDEEVLIAQGRFSQLSNLRPVLSVKDVVFMREVAHSVAMAAEQSVVDYAVGVARGTMSDNFERAAGVRASRDLVRVAAAKATTEGRVGTTIEDIQVIAHLVLRHRVEMAYDSNKSFENALMELL